MLEKLIINMKPNICQEPCEDPLNNSAVITVEDDLGRSVVKMQEVCGQTLECLLVKISDYCFKNISVKSHIVTLYAFKVLYGISALKSSISRDCFKQLELTKFVSTRIFECLNELDCSSKNMEKREYLHELLGNYFLSDHIDDYITNSHWILDGIFRQQQNEQNATQQVYDKLNQGRIIQSAQRCDRHAKSHPHIGCSRGLHASRLSSH